MVLLGLYDVNFFMTTKYMTFGEFQVVLLELSGAILTLTRHEGTILYFFTWGSL